jgi:hypothetical protein
MVLSGGSMTAGHGAHPQPMALDGSSSGMGTPRAMETDIPGGLKPTTGSTLKLSTAINIVAAANTDHLQQHGQQQQHQAPVVLAAHQRHSSGGLDVLTTGGMRGQADQASLVTTGTPVKLQPSGGPQATTASGCVNSAVALFLAQQKQQQQQQQYAADANTWAPTQAPVEQRHMQDANRTGNFSQQQHQQQAMLMQQQLDMAVVGQGVGNNGPKQQQQQHLGSVLMDRLLPRLH